MAELNKLTAGDKALVCCSSGVLQQVGDGNFGSVVHLSYPLGSEKEVNLHLPHLWLCWELVWSPAEAQVGSWLLSTGCCTGERCWSAAGAAPAL